MQGTLLYVAVTNVFVNGTRLEGKGVTPDITVPFNLEYASGADPQTEKAIEVVLRFGHKNAGFMLGCLEGVK